MTRAGEAKSTEPVTFSRPAVVGTLAEIGLVLDVTKTLLAKLQPAHAPVLEALVASRMPHKPGGRSHTPPPGRLDMAYIVEVTLSAGDPDGPAVFGGGAGAQGPDRLRQPAGNSASLTAGSAYDCDPVD